MNLLTSESLHQSGLSRPITPSNFDELSSRNIKLQEPETSFNNSIAPSPKPSVKQISLKLNPELDESNSNANQNSKGEDNYDSLIKNFQGKKSNTLPIGGGHVFKSFNSDF